MRTMRTHLPVRILWPLLAVVVPSGCTYGPRTATLHPRTGDITRAELQSAGYGNTYHAIARLRPNWLWEHGPKTIQNPDPYPTVYVDGMLRGGLGELHRIPLADIETIRRISASDATTIWGTGHMSGVILVTTRRGRGRGPLRRPTCVTVPDVVPSHIAVASAHAPGRPAHATPRTPLRQRSP